jgi:hypothetical protein
MSSNRLHSLLAPGRRLVAIAATLLLVGSTTAQAQAPDVRLVEDASGWTLQVDGDPFMVLGMNWDYFPIGQNYAYSFWSEPDEMIMAALDREMSLLKSMGVNTIRQYVGVPPRWVQYIYERYGIFTVLNHAVGRYGVTVDGVWIESTDYSDRRTRELLKAEVLEMVEEFRGTPGLLMWLLGNENNYGLVWSSAETEDLPEGERDAAKARYLYSLFGEITRAIQAKNTGIPVAMANGDLQYIDIIAEEMPTLDVFGANVYRGISFRDLFEVVNDKLGVPVMFTEFGADAWNAKEMREDQYTQARYLLGQWKEIYANSSGKGLVGNSIGGLTFQWSDGWWKFRQDEFLDVHDTNASWANDAYPEDYVEGSNNMNEEWWGVAAKGPTDARGLYNLYPRAAFYALQSAYTLDPYGPGVDRAAIYAHFDAIQPSAAVLQARGDDAARVTDILKRVRISNLRMEFETYNTGGSKISTPPAETPQPELPAYRGFDHQQSFFVEAEVQPAENLIGRLSVNVLGNVGVNQIDEIFYENRGRRQTIEVDGEPLELQSLERVKVYRGSVNWDEDWFSLRGFYREGHFHWGYDGDFFGVYRNAFYGDNIDIYNGIAPVGAEIHFKKSLEGLRVAFGPQLWWGANPAVMGMYTRQFGSFGVSALYQEEFAQQQNVVTSLAVPLPKNRRASLAVTRDFGNFGLEVGGLWSGSTKIDETFQVVDGPEDNLTVLQDSVRLSDTFGGKAKLTWQSGRWNWYGQYSYAGIVADGGPDETTTFTGWVLKDHGAGNGNQVTTGLAVNLGTFQIGPNFLWQKPLVGPIPGDVPAPGRPRNVIDDPFAVRISRETVAGELLLTHDPTPATWFWAWDNDIREDAKLAWSVGVTFKHFPTTMDAAIGVLEDGRTFFAFPGATPSRDLWEVRARFVSRLAPDVRAAATIFAGTGEPNGDDTRLIHRYGIDGRITWSRVAFAMFAKFGDWGPYDYHRDFNLTFPVHLMGDVSYTLGAPRWFGWPQTRIGLRATWRSLDEFSNRYCPVGVPDARGIEVCDSTAVGFGDGSEWEIRTYLHVSL